MVVNLVYWLKYNIRKSLLKRNNLAKYLKKKMQIRLKYERRYYN